MLVNTHDDDNDKENNIIDYNNQQLHNLRLQPDFEYYQKHEFHKLSRSLIKKTKFSVFYIQPFAHWKVMLKN